MTIYPKKNARGQLSGKWMVEVTEALEEAIVTMRSPANERIRLTAARVVLEWTMANPVSKSEVTVKSAEDWLRQLI